MVVLAAVACGGSPVTEPTPDAPIDHVEAVVAGRVTDPVGAPLELAIVSIGIECPPPYDGCSGGRSVYTFAEGRFVASFEIGLQTSFPLEARIVAYPPVGMGYTLGATEALNLPGSFQPAPVADTTFVQLVLPPNHVDSRRPARVELGHHRSYGLRADAERFYLSASIGVVAWDPATGEALWVRGNLGGLAGPAYVLLGDRVIIAGIGSLFGVRAPDGEPLWNREAMANRTLTVAEPDGLYATDGEAVVAYDPETGATRWRRELIGTGNIVIAASPALVCAEILAYVECWEPATGDPVWSRPTDFASWLRIAGGKVLLGSGADWTALDARTGDVVWEATIGEGPGPELGPDGDLAYACPGSACLAVRVADGQVAWRTPFEGGATGGPVIHGDAMYVRVGEGDDESSLYVLDAASGAIRERILPDPFLRGFCGTPAANSDYLVVFGCDSLYTFRMAP